MKKTIILANLQQNFNKYCLKKTCGYFISSSSSDYNLDTETKKYKEHLIFLLVKTTLEHTNPSTSHIHLNKAKVKLQCSIHKSIC